MIITPQQKEKCYTHEAYRILAGDSTMDAPLMRSYVEYASVYDAIGQARAGLRALDLLLAHEPMPGEPAGRALDLGCGTGSALIQLTAGGWAAVGIDRAPAMLRIASGRARDARTPLTLVEHDFLRYQSSAEGLLTLPARERAASETPQRRRSPLAMEAASFDLVLCLGDTLSELTGDHDLDLLCTLAAKALRPGGVFAIDARTPAAFGLWDAHDEVLHDEAGLLVYVQRDYTPRSRLASARIVWLSREGERWWRGEETHMLRCWDAAQIAAALARVGLGLEACLDTAGRATVEDTPRALYIARK
jgi:SAM-dependent methyltransferase